LRESGDIVREMSANVIRVALKFWEIEWAVIVETEVLAAPRDLIEDRIHVLDLALFELLATLHHFCLRRREYAVEAAKHRHRQHDTLILRRSVWAAQQICDGPDKVGELLEIRRRHALESDIAGQ